MARSRDSEVREAREAVLPWEAELAAEAQEMSGLVRPVAASSSSPAAEKLLFGFR